MNGANCDIWPPAVANSKIAYRYDRQHRLSSCGVAPINTQQAFTELRLGTSTAPTVPETRFKATLVVNGAIFSMLPIFQLTLRHFAVGGDGNDSCGCLWTVTDNNNTMDLSSVAVISCC